MIRLIRFIRLISRGYLTGRVSEALLRPLAVAVRVTFPGLEPACTMAVQAPEKRGICGRWKRSREVGSPLAAAR